MLTERGGRNGERYIDKKMRVLTIEPFNRLPPDARPFHNGSLGVLSLAGALKQSGFETDYLDATIGDDNPNRIANEKGLIRRGASDEQIAEKVGDYDVVAVSSNYTQQTFSVLKIAEIVKEINPNALLIGGGTCFRSDPERFLKAGFDALGSGIEGEETIVSLLEAVENREDWRETSGLLILRNEQMVNTGTPKTTQDLDLLPFPAFEILPLENYWEMSVPHGGNYSAEQMVKDGPIETSRGCQFSCCSCHNSKIDTGIRFKSPRRVYEEVLSLKKLGVEWLSFADDSLLTKRRRAMDIFTAIEPLKMKLIMANGVNLVHLFKRKETGKLEVNRDLLELMARAGLKQLVLPFESGSKRIIDKYASRKWNPETLDVVKLMQIARELGIVVPGNFMIGFPDENMEELNQTIKLAKRLRSEGLAYASFFIVTPYPETKLFDMAVAEGRLSSNFDPDGFHWGNPTMKTDIPAEELLRVRHDVWREINDSEFINEKLESQIIPERFESQDKYK